MLKQIEPIDSLANKSIDSLDIVAQSVYKMQQQNLKALSGKGEPVTQQ
jgi:hypothetical protein